MSKFKITETPHIIDDHLLDIIGNEFKFDHAKGLAEWLKNSADAYNREDVNDEDQYIFMRMKQKTSAASPARFECIDFVGMTHDEIESAFKRWGDPQAASRGKSRKNILGGHGNGGKFYMRQMFAESRFITYRNGLLNVFGFNENKKYGFDRGYEKKRVKLDRAMELADLEEVLTRATRSSISERKMFLKAFIGLTRKPRSPGKFWINMARNTRAGANICFNGTLIF